MSVKGMDKISAKSRQRGSRTNGVMTEEALVEDARFVPERRASLASQLVRGAGKTSVGGSLSQIAPNPVNLRSLNRKGPSAPSRR